MDTRNLDDKVKDLPGTDLFDVSTFSKAWFILCMEAEDLETGVVCDRKNEGGQGPVRERCTDADADALSLNKIRIN